MYCKYLMFIFRNYYTYIDCMNSDLPFERSKETKYNAFGIWIYFERETLFSGGDLWKAFLPSTNIQLEKGLLSLKTNSWFSLFTLIISQSEWPKDKPFLLTHSRRARNFYDPKIIGIFEIAWTVFEIIQFIHFYSLKKHLEVAISA